MSAELDYDIVDKAVDQSKLIAKSLEFGELRPFSNIDNRNFVFREIVEPVDDMANGLNKTRRGNKQRATTLHTMVNIVRDVLLSAADYELTKASAKLRAETLRRAITQVEEMKKADQVTEEQAYALKHQTTANLFAMSTEQTRADVAWFKDKYSSTKRLFRKFSGSMLMHVSPIITDELANQMGITFSIVENYTHIPNQKFLAVNASRIDQVLPYARQYAPLNHTVCEDIWAAAPGIVYVWIPTTKMLTLMADHGMEINAWACVRPNS